MADLFPDSLPGISAQIAEIHREIEMRTRHYPNFIRRGILTRENADRQMLALRAVLVTLEGVSGEREE